MLNYFSLNFTPKNKSMSWHRPTVWIYLEELWDMSSNNFLSYAIGLECSFLYTQNLWLVFSFVNF